MRKFRGRIRQLGCPGSPHGHAFRLPLEVSPLIDVDFADPVLRDSKLGQPVSLNIPLDMFERERGAIVLEGAAHLLLGFVGRKPHKAVARDVVEGSKEQIVHPIVHFVTANRTGSSFLDRLDHRKAVNKVRSGPWHGQDAACSKAHTSAPWMSYTQGGQTPRAEATTLRSSSRLTNDQPHLAVSWAGPSSIDPSVCTVPVSIPSLGRIPQWKVSVADLWSPGLGIIGV